MPMNKLQLSLMRVISTSSGVLIIVLASVHRSDVVIQPFENGINLIKWSTCVNTCKNQFSEIIDIRLRHTKDHRRPENTLAEYVVS